MAEYFVVVMNVLRPEFEFAVHGLTSRSLKTGKNMQLAPIVHDHATRVVLIDFADVFVFWYCILTAIRPIIGLNVSNSSHFEFWLTPICGCDQGIFVGFG